ncbi:isocitrate/isopropylmalate family dehydrogenase [Legionella feeleii]|uniref:DlpA protein n=1 Tax=Legionella feeleii TaxID=453 RepID=A0A378J6R8_9GAMM|nr:isocitrate/isopropylmalate family dehydrogenase [Legionella feeleii]STX39984.1 DlpA protein [Legionella feeleii]
MKPKKVLKIAVLPGDGIGVEVIEAAIPVFTALKIPVELNFGEVGWSFWQKEGNPLPERTWKLINQSDTTLLGAITSKPKREAIQELAPEFKQAKLNYVSPIIQLRQKLDLFANVRPCFNIKRDVKDFNFCIIRENTEGLYSGFDYYPLPTQLHSLLDENKHWQKIAKNEISCTLRLQTKVGLIRLFEFAFKYANEQGIKRVTFADKPNVLRQSSDFARELFEAVSSQYSQITADILNIDAMALWLVRRPEEFGVIVAENMFGDILSDLGAGVMGGLGFAPSANIGIKGCYFEPVHGSAPRIGSNRSNPSAMFLTIGLLLNHFGYTEAAEKIKQAVAAIVRQGKFVTYDVGGHATTQEMAQAIIEHCLNQAQETDMTKKEQASPIRGQESKQQIEALRMFNSAEIADALDACGVEGAITNLKPLSPGVKLIGPAYTIKYLPYEQQPDAFKGAANYIDAVPAQSVIVIDNQGRNDCTTWGEILTQVALKKSINGTIVNGAVRDVKFIREASYPVFCSGYFMRSGKNRVYMADEQCPLNINGIAIKPGDIIFADDNGVLVIPAYLVTEIIEKAHNIKITEQRINAAVQRGVSLEQARKDYRYDQPWLKHSDE